jgi:hypothetical protein
MRLRDLRHSCATLLLAQGVSPRVILETSRTFFDLATHRSLGWIRGFPSSPASSLGWQKHQRQVRDQRAHVDVIAIRQHDDRQMIIGKAGEVRGEPGEPAAMPDVAMRDDFHLMKSPQPMRGSRRRGSADGSCCCFPDASRSGLRSGTRHPAAHLTPRMARRSGLLPPANEL